MSGEREGRERDEDINHEDNVLGKHAYPHPRPVMSAGISFLHTRSGLGSLLLDIAP